MMIMTSLALSACALIVLSLVSMFCFTREDFHPGFFGGLLAFILSAYTLVIVTGGSWKGYVSAQVESLARRLEVGVAYQLVGSVVGDFGLIVLVKETGTSADLYAIRIKEAPPEYFALVDGKPVAVSAPPISK